MTFESLARDRREYVDVTRRNRGFEEGLRQLLAHLYPDNAHFIYELLQNAEDAGAREVTFDLRSDGLRFEHDGTRLFNLRDIESITGIGQSTKVDDHTSIGKFGVGFKAVYSYTQSPRIHSGEHSFEILDLFVPALVEPDTRPGLTTFWFPFDRSEKPAERASAELSKALREISRSTLLFLNNIKMIACYLPDGDERLLERREVTDHIVAIESVHEELGPSYWYRITGDVLIGEKRYPVAAAFALDKKQAADASQAPKPGPKGKLRQAATPEFAVQPVDGQVFIYFPAVKETSGLKFHIHAPFASTVARDSVRDGDGNDELIAGIADLLAEDLPAMRDADLVTDGLLSALPNNDDGLPERYKVIRERVLETFQTEPITPMFRGGYSRATELLRSVSALRTVLTPEDVDVLREISVGVGENPAAGWLPEGVGRPRGFLDSLEAIDFGPSELAEVFERLEGVRSDLELWGDQADEHVDDADRADLQSWYDWISGKDTQWLRSFYAGLGRLSQQPGHNPYGHGDYRRRYWSDPFPDSLAAAPVVRVQNGAAVEHVVGAKAHLPTTPGLRVDSLVLDSLVAFSEGEGKAEKQEADALKQFFIRTGVKNWDAVTQLDARLDSYGTEVDFEDHFEDLRTLDRLLQDRVVTASDYSARPILLASDGNGGLIWTRPSKIYLDDPYGATGLGALYGAEAVAGRDHMRPLVEEYMSSDVDVAGLARELGARSTLQIVSADPRWDNAEFNWSWVEYETHKGTQSDWTIRLFDEIIATEDETLLRTLWRVVAAAPSNRGDAYYQANASRPRHPMKSQLLQKLTSTPWVLDRYGNLNLPEDMTPADLDDALEVPGDAPLLLRAGFGRKAATDEKIKASADEVAQQLGFDSSDDLARLAGLRRKNPKRFEDLLGKMETELELPEDASAAPEHRARRSAESAMDAPSRRYEQRMRSVPIQEPGHLSAARNYLREFYTNSQGVMVCQACSSAMPFKVKGEYYFEAVRFVADVQRDLREVRIALCPTCAAMHRYARSTTDSELRDDLQTQDVGTHDSITVDVVLAGEERTIRFVGKHAIDLQAALDATEATSH
ncbi:hypothetical protein GCM10027063_39850 [Promicromonospora xylanilytica]